MPEMIPLSNGGYALVDESDVPLVAGRRWRKMKSSRSVYAISGQGKDAILMHRLILRAAPGQQVDHANGMGLNNTRANLRLCTAAENSRNRRYFGGSASGVKGVKPVRLIGGGVKYAAVITASGERIHLGTFDSKGAAAKAYRQAAKRFHRDFARAA